MLAPHLRGRSGAAWRRGGAGAGEEIRQQPASAKKAAQFVEVIFPMKPSHGNGMLRPNLKIDRKAIRALSSLANLSLSQSQIRQRRRTGGGALRTARQDDGRQTQPAETTNMSTDASR